ncbi:hypothetical protein BJ508DRAFT_315651 [Ascobolus immersus RN42]|uniref:Uncharacterized protein n=1 Tax=Ascobolus immersus RN42 TaxID=1160509 RepID=A0A3N4H9X1_ASCIM|nr:hypothetical protein BJ508DRAFT_315651 [Ascobolus immersus RN42]
MVATPTIISDLRDSLLFWLVGWILFENAVAIITSSTALSVDGNDDPVEDAIIIALLSLFSFLSLLKSSYHIVSRLQFKTSSFPRSPSLAPISPHKSFHLSLPSQQQHHPNFHYHRPRPSPTPPSPVDVDEPEDGARPVSWIVNGIDKATRVFVDLLSRARPVCWTTKHSLTCQDAMVRNTRRTGPREKPDVNNDSGRACNTQEQEEQVCYPATLPSVKSRARLCKQSFNNPCRCHLQLPQATISHIQTVDDHSHRLFRPARDELGVLLQVSQIIALLPPALHHEGVPEVLRKLGLPAHLDQSDTVRLVIQSNVLLHPSLPTMPEVLETVAFCCRNLQEPSHRHLESLTVMRTRTCTRLMILTSANGIERSSTNETHVWPLNFPQNLVISIDRRRIRQRGTRHHFRRIQRRKEQRRADPQRAGHHATNHPSSPQPTTSPTLHPQTSVPASLSLNIAANKLFQTMSSSSDSENDGLFQRPPIELVRSALKLDTSLNTKAVTMIQRIARVRRRYGVGRWNELREDYPPNITYEEQDFSTLRRDFLRQYEQWYATIHPLPPAPAELLGIRRRRATTEPPATPSPPPLPNPSQDAGLSPNPNNSVVLHRPPPPPTTPRRSPALSVWLSTQGARLARMLPGFPRFGTPRSPSPTIEQMLPGQYPHTSESLQAELRQQDAFLEVTHLLQPEFILPSEELLADSVLGLPDLHLSLADFHTRTESLYSDEADRQARQLYMEEQEFKLEEEEPSLVEPSSFRHLRSLPTPPICKLWEDETDWRVNEQPGQIESEEEDSFLPPMSYYPHQPLFTQNHPARQRTAAASPHQPDDVADYFSFPQATARGQVSPASFTSLGNPPQKSSSVASSPLHPPNFSSTPLPVLPSPPHHRPLSPSSTPSPSQAPAVVLSPIMATLSADQLATFIKSITDTLVVAKPTKMAFKDAKVAIFYPGLPVDAQHPAGRQCVVNGQTYYRSPRLMKGEILSLLEVVDGAELARGLPTKMEGSARTWYRDILTKDERDLMLKDASCELWISKLLAQFEREDEDPMATLYDNKFTVARLRAGEDISSWLMEHSAIIGQSGIEEARKPKTLYACLDADLKNEFGPPGLKNMNEYMSHIQSRASVYRQKLVQQDNESRAMQARTVNDIVSIVRASRPSINQSVPSFSQGQPSQYQQQQQRPIMPPVSVSVTANPTPQAVPTSVPFTGRPCRFCGGAHMDNLCSQKPGNRPCRFCAGPHFDHNCPQKPAGFKNCGICSGAHYTSVCPNKDSANNQLRPTPSPTFNMQVGQPSPVTNKTAVQTSAFVHSSTASSTAAGSMDDRDSWLSPSPPAVSASKCGTCQAQFPTHQALYTHAVLSGHQVDMHEPDAHSVQFLYSDYGSSDYDSAYEQAGFDPVQVHHLHAIHSLTDPSSPHTTTSVPPSPNGTAINPLSEGKDSAASVSTSSHPPTSSNAPLALQSTTPLNDVTPFSESFLPLASTFEQLASTPPTLESPVIIPSSYSKNNGIGTVRTNYLEIAIQFQASVSATVHWICLDTGCGISLVSEVFLRRVLSNIRYVSCAPVPFRGINDRQPSLTSRMVQLTYYIPGDRRIVNGNLIDDRGKYAAFVRHFLVVPELFCDMIIGTDTQIATGMVIDFHHMALTITSCKRMLATLRVVPKKQAKATFIFWIHPVAYARSKRPRPEKTSFIVHP